MTTTEGAGLARVRNLGSKGRQLDEARARELEAVLLTLRA